MMKEKMKDLMRKVTSSSSSSSSSSSFKGTAHVLGSGPDPSSRPSNPTPSRPAAPRREAAASARPPSSGFAPYSPLISTSSRRTDPPAGAGAGEDDAVACPSCAEPFPSELAVSDHLDGCLAAAGGARPRAAAYLAGDPPASAVEVVKRLLGNLLSDPRNDKYRKVRLGNPRIKEALADREGGVDLLEAVGFRVADEGGELFALMDEVPGDARLGGIRQAVLLLERARPSTPPQTQADAKETCPNGVSEEQGIKKPVDRQIRVFFSVAASSVAENDLPDSFYSLSNEEIRNEAKMRRERLEQSRLLIPKSYKEKQALAARQKYKQALIRIQFPDGVILQGVFLPAEPISSLYEFVASSLKQPSLEFDLICPAGPRTRVIPPFPKPGEQARTLRDEDLVPSARLTFKPKETDSVVFTGLLDELLETNNFF
ncbi:Os09g0401600 [Oryza sativa Japonica Group]|uniref:Os09g0401600 protein n=1 Tax=Oryza sativa subsp. japonica TaxID=39947 RepID=Q0J1X9_ORYSJ|nr:Os09g0401600 [Oryza sativa Japonica Group]|eukprot:NP_001063122.2 Os09g0401600 [Oryza sativa Japonica Group]